jgi:hypothetical protein
MATSQPTYTGGVTSLVQRTGTTLIDALIGGSKWGTGGAGTAAALTFSFPATTAAFDTRSGVAGNYGENDPLGADLAPKLAAFSPFDAAQQEAARQVLQAYAHVVNLSFTEVDASSPDAGVLRFGNSAPPGMGLPAGVCLGFRRTSQVRATPGSIRPFCSLKAGRLARKTF